jgi:hypothetical protein
LRIFQPVLLGQRDGAFGKALEDEIIEVAAFGEFDRRFDPVPE